MKTTELFVDHVLIGLLVVATLWMLSPIPLPGLGEINLGNASVLVAVSYFAGILYDRFADTLLQDMESHQRLSVSVGDLMAHRDCPQHSGIHGNGQTEDADDRADKATQRPAGTGGANNKDVDRFPNFPEPRWDGKPPDIFDDKAFRMIVIRNPQAADYSDFLRSRIRLTRSLATLLPGMSLALVAHLSIGTWQDLTAFGNAESALMMKLYLYDDSGQWALVVLASLIYGATFLNQIWKNSILRDSTSPPSAPFRWARPPKTSLTKEQLNRYDEMLGLPDWQRSKGRSQFRAIWRIDPILCLYPFVFMILGTLLALCLAPGICIAIPAAGLILTLLAAWTWWRISRTFMLFTRNFAKSESANHDATPQKHPYSRASLRSTRFGGLRR